MANLFTPASPATGPWYIDREDCIGDSLSYINANTNYLGIKIDSVFSPGMIMMWSGSIATIPTGWALCDGQNSTPDLRDRFIVGAGSLYQTGNTGGLSAVTLSINEIPAHSHGVNDPGHTHTRGTIYPGSAVEQNQSGGPDGPRTDFNQNTGQSVTGITINNTGGNSAHENRPPYYALAFIIKI